MARPNGTILGFIPYDFRLPTLERVRKTLWNAREERFIVPTIFGVGWTVNLRSAPRHPLQAGLLLALILWRLRSGRGR